MHSQRATSLRSTWILCLFGCIVSLPVDKGFGSNSSPAWSDFSSRGSAYPYPPQEYYGEEPSTGSQQNSDSKADGGVYSDDGSYMGAGDSGWAKNGGMDSGSDAYYPVPEGRPEALVTSNDEQEEPVLSDVSDLDPVYHFSSRSRYQQGRRAFFLTRYSPGEPMDAYADMSDSNSNGMGNGKGWPVVAGESGKGGY